MIFQFGLDGDLLPQQEEPLGLQGTFLQHSQVWTRCGGGRPGYDRTGDLSFQIGTKENQMHLGRDPGEHETQGTIKKRIWPDEKSYSVSVFSSEKWDCKYLPFLSKIIFDHLGEYTLENIHYSSEV